MALPCAQQERDLDLHPRPARRPSRSTPSGQPTAEADLNGNTTTLSLYFRLVVDGDRPGRADPDLRLYSGSLLSSVTDSSGRSVQFGYTSGNLISLTDADGHITQFTYDSSYRLLTMLDPDQIRGGTPDRGDQWLQLLRAGGLGRKISWAARPPSPTRTLPDHHHRSEWQRDPRHLHQWSAGRPNQSIRDLEGRHLAVLLRPDKPRSHRDRTPMAMSASPLTTPEGNALEHTDANGAVNTSTYNA